VCAENPIRLDGAMESPKEARLTLRSAFEGGTDPYPAVPSACASATVLVRAKAVASSDYRNFHEVVLIVRQETTTSSARQSPKIVF
jgi:hypothetical protein